ncbi:MAG: nitroreductase family protein [Planctomycetota bacterium]|jgi:nitroreductase|nr:nitroreductase family protein [Planctomycetota bacterium]
MAKDEDVSPVPKFNLSRAEYLEMDPVEFRARFRERLHHTLEIQTYAAIHEGKTLGPTQTATVENLLDLWHERGLPTNLPDYRWGGEILQFAKKAQAGEKVDLSPYETRPVGEDEYQSFKRIVEERRSVRHWSSKKVPDSIIDEILLAGTWGAHSCNLQSLRFAVVREDNEPGLFRGADIPGGPVHLVALQDERVYKANPLNPIRNRLIDVGAAVQNMALAAHALGLGGVWLTFSDAMLERLYKRFKLPKEVKIVTYLDVGYPAQSPVAPGRLDLKETVLVKI